MSYATLTDALGEVENIIERWEAQRPPYSDENAEKWIHECNIVAQRFIKRDVISWIERAFETGQSCTKRDLAGTIYSGFEAIMADFLERHHSTTPPP